MPPRLITAAILIFWLGMTGWLMQREVVPMMLADLSPSIQPDLTDEIGNPVISWTILRKGKRAGSAQSRIVLKGEGTLELYSTFNFAEPILTMTKLECMERIADGRRLQAMSIKFETESRLVAEIRGEVVNQKMAPKLFHNGIEVKFLDLGTIDMAHQADVTNPMNLVNRVRDLYDGRTWKVTMFNPLQGVQNQLVSDIMKPMMVPALIAQVSVDTLQWNDEDVVCYRIEYHEVGKEVIARTWVRKSDGLVLQQESSHLGFEM
ncbi:MAG: hypothetical protein HY289_11795, partial [Planctomycetes bacterium]|nr:hypothetical protein [Planctomycetota bacterium]